MDESKIADSASPLDVAVRNAEDAYNRIRAPCSPFFHELDGGTRCVALAAAMIAGEPLRQALSQIAAMETPGANSTVKRMAATARAVLAQPISPLSRRQC